MAAKKSVSKIVAKPAISKSKVQKATLKQKIKASKISKSKPAKIDAKQAPVPKLEFSKPVEGELSSEEVDSMHKQLDNVLIMEKDILSEEKHLEKKEDSMKREENKIESEEKLLEKLEEKTELTEHKEEDELSKLEKLESQIKSEVGTHPLSKITLKDIVKGFVGAFIGLAVHYTFTYGVEIAQTLDMTRATLLYLVSFFIGILFIYATGFRKVKDPQVLLFMPVRLIILYVESIMMSILVLLIFYPSFGASFQESYKMVAGVLLAAIIGACTADLIGKD